MSTPDMLLLDVKGEPTLYVGPALVETLPPRMLEGLARRRLVATGELKVVLIGGSPRVRVADLLGYVESRDVELKGAS